VATFIFFVHTVVLPTDYLIAFSHIWLVTFHNRGKLAEYHLRDAMRNKRMLVMESALELTFFPVLERVDRALYHHLVVQTGFTTMPEFLVRWVSNWFASDMVDLAAASRLVDAFLVSHPSLPLYCSVALFACHRHRFLECEDLKDVFRLLKTLPLFAAGANESNNQEVDDELTIVSHGSGTGCGSRSLDKVEKIITAALGFMYVNYRQ